MKRFLFLFTFAGFIFISCVSKTKLVSGENSELQRVIDTIALPKLNQITLKDSVINYGKLFLRTPYRYGANGSTAFDCSGFTSYIFRNFGFDLERTSRDQAKQFPTIKKSEIQTGDLVFFEGRRRNGVVGHVGIVTEKKPNGEFNFIHASINKGVTISSSEEPYYNARYVKGGRVLDDKYFIINPQTNVSLYQGNSNRSKLNRNLVASYVLEPLYHTVEKGETLASISQDYDVPISTIQRLNGLKGKKIKKNQRLMITEAVFVSTEPTLAKAETINSQKLEQSPAIKTVVLPVDVVVSSPTPKIPEQPAVYQKDEQPAKLVQEPKSVSKTSETSVTQDLVRYRVKAGESLFSIAKEHNLTVNELKALNNLTSNNINAGTMLIVKKAEIEPNVQMVAENSNKPTPAAPSFLKHTVKKGETLYSISRLYHCTIDQIKEWNKNIIGNNLQIGAQLLIAK